MTGSWTRLRGLAGLVLNLRYLVSVGSVVLVLIFGFAAVLVYQNAGVMRDQINADFNQQQFSLARQAVYQIDGRLGDIEMELQGLRRLLAGGASPDLLVRTMEGALTRGAAKGLLRLQVFDRSGRERQSLPAAPSRKGAVQRGCPPGPEGRMVLEPLRTEETAGGEVRVVSEACLTLSGRDGFLLGKIDVSGLVGGVTRHIRSGKTGYAWVVDQEGLFLFHPEREFIGRSALEARRERKPYISFAQINSIMKDRMLRGEEGTGEYVSGWHRGIEGEMAKLIGFSPVLAPALPGGSVWSVAVVAPKIEVADAVNYIYVRNTAAGAAIIAGMLVFGLLIMLYQRRISRALQERVEKTEADFQEMARIHVRVVEQATDLIYIVDQELRVVLLNQQTADVLADRVVKGGDPGSGSPEDDPRRKEFFIGRSFADILGPEDVAFLRAKVGRVLETRRSLSYEHTLESEGRRTRLSTKLVPIRDDQGRIRLILGIGRDVTEKFEMDQHIYNAEKLASIGTLASGVAHEINNPLSVILGFTDLLLERAKPGSPEHADLKTIETQAVNAKKIVENLLGFARVTEGSDDSVDVGAALETVNAIVSNTMLTRKMELVVKVPESLPRVRGDSREFQQVIFNLVNNSIASMGSDGGRIELSAQAEGDWVRVEVRDTGPGIPESIRPRIFDPFFTTKKVGQGTGLGLSLCYGIVKKFGGKISFTSVSKTDRAEEESGTVFVVSLPASDTKGGAGG